jgi:hypothetical protein
LPDFRKLIADETEKWGQVVRLAPASRRSRGGRISPRAPGGRNSWENFRNLLKQNRLILQQLGKKPREIKAPLGTHAPQQAGAYSIAI